MTCLVYLFIFLFFFWATNCVGCRTDRWWCLRNTTLLAKSCHQLSLSTEYSSQEDNHLIIKNSENDLWKTKNRPLYVSFQKKSLNFGQQCCHVILPIYFFNYLWDHSHSSLTNVLTWFIGSRHHTDRQ